MYSRLETPDLKHLISSLTFRNPQMAIPASCKTLKYVKIHFGNYCELDITVFMSSKRLLIL